MKTNLMLAASLLLLIQTSGCAKGGGSTGYWEGTGSATEVMINEPMKKLARSATTQFWFNVAHDGTITGEAEAVYDVQLTTKLPSANGGFVGINPVVDGKVTDLDPHRRFPIVGRIEGGRLSLEPVFDGVAPIEFTIHSDAGISGSPSVGPGTVTPFAAGVPGTKADQKIPVPPFSPFSAPGARTGTLERRSPTVFAASSEVRTDHFAIHWSAHQVSPDVRSLTLTPAMQNALDHLMKQTAR